MNILLEQAREHHHAAIVLDRRARRRRELRNQLICQLRAEDPDKWTYQIIAVVLGVSPELIANISRAGKEKQEQRKGT